jgi:micrococcal nuclease
MSRFQKIAATLCVAALLIISLVQYAQAKVEETWVRHATVVKVVDGDTMDLDVNLGYRVTFSDRFRLYGIDTPEVYGVKKTSEEYQKGLKASAFAKEWVAKQEGKVLVRSAKDRGKYGRWLATIYAADGEGESLNDLLVSSGNAVYRKY